jgi:hypothetical protein
MKPLISKLQQFERWFNARFGWFFTNGMKAINDRSEMH